MKKWENPEVTNLTVSDTNEDTCYCETGELARGGRPGNGHQHKPPHQGGSCPDKPVPPIAGPEDPTFS